MSNPTLLVAHSHFSNRTKAKQKCKRATKPTLIQEPTNRTKTKGYAYNISLAKTAGNDFDLKFFANFEISSSVESLCLKVPPSPSESNVIGQATAIPRKRRIEENNNNESEIRQC